MAADLINLHNSGMGKGLEFLQGPFPSHAGGPNGTCFLSDHLAYMSEEIVDVFVATYHPDWMTSIALLLTYCIVYKLNEKLAFTTSFPYNPDQVNDIMVTR